MNQSGKERAEQLAQKEYSLMEYRNKLVRMQNMDCVCHCSAEIDMGTLLYFSVNDLYLGQGYYVLLLFSEVSPSSDEQREGRNVFGRMFTYAIIEEIAKEAFTGHYSFFSSELDGRLVLMLSFPFGLLPDRSIVDYLDENCREVSQRCKTLYDLNVVTYIGEPIDNVQYISSVYSKLLEMATLHRYIDWVFDDSVFHVPLPAPTKWSARGPDIQSRAKELVGVILSGGDYHASADETLTLLAQHQPSSVDTIKRLFGDYFEMICKYASEIGIKLKYDTLREELFHILFDSVSWSDPVNWLHHTLDSLSESYSAAYQSAAKKQFDMALQYIESSLSDQNLTLESCAAHVNCSVSALSKAFRRQMNTSAARYIREKRLEKALELLHTGCTVGDTCVQCGFGSTETFHRAFKEKYGVTPGQVRNAKHTSD